VPASGACTPARILTSVDLPAPFSPTSACDSPAYSSRWTSRSAATAPNDFDTSVSASSGRASWSTVIRRKLRFVNRFTQVMAER
jgi:hypothetical protein